MVRIYETKEKLIQALHTLEEAGIIDETTTLMYEEKINEEIQ